MSQLRHNYVTVTSQLRHVNKFRLTFVNAGDKGLMLFNHVDDIAINLSNVLFVYFVTNIDVVNKLKRIYLFCLAECAQVTTSKPEHLILDTLNDRFLDYNSDNILLTLMPSLY